MGDGIVVDGTVASSESQIQAIWPLRERIAEALLKDGYRVPCRLKVPLQEGSDVRSKGLVRSCANCGRRSRSSPTRRRTAI